jgi:hypothetical protein
MHGAPAWLRRRQRSAIRRWHDTGQGKQRQRRFPCTWRLEQRSYGFIAGAVPEPEMTAAIAAE